MPRCCDCGHLNRNDEYKDWFSGKTSYKCIITRDYKKLDDFSCYNFSELRVNNRGFKQSGCFITTLVCEVLGYDDNCEILTTLRHFRDNYLKLNSKFLPILLEYDQIGPQISEKIKNEANNEKFCLGLLKYFLIPTVQKIKEEKFEEAVSYYQNMVIHLKEEFMIYDTTDLNQNYDLETLGKGRIRTKKTID